MLFGPALAQPATEHKFVVCIGRDSEKVDSGTLWLYSYSWYGVQQYKLAAIQNGLAVVPLDVNRLKREADPHPNTDAYVLVVQTGKNMWYRTPDIPQDRFWTDLPGAISSLGQTTMLATGETQLILPSPAKRHITLLYPDGRPKAGMDLTVSIYLSDRNHCGFHEGLPLGNFRTDANGTIDVLAPLVPLYLDGLEYYEQAGAGPAGPAYSSNMGMKIPAEEAVVVKVTWEVPDFTVQLRVLTGSGRPRPDVDVYAIWNTNTCGGADRIARTDAKGIVTLDLDATFTALSLMIGGPYSSGPEHDRNTRELTAAELHELFSKGKLTIRWSPVAAQVPPMLTRPLGYWTSIPVNCANVSGEWADPENGGRWTLSQTGDDITGSLTMLEPDCGSVTWQVAGRMKSGLATLNATHPTASVDGCAAPAAASITVTRAPYCNRSVRPGN